MDPFTMESALTDQVQLDLLHHTRHAIAHLIELFPAEFGWERLIPADARTLPQVPEKLGQLYQEIEEYCSTLAVKFDHDWHWSLMWRQQLSLKTLADRYGKDYVIGACHPRIRKFVAQIYIEELDPFMQWFPWSWFSNMQFIGAGGFSAVYAATISQPYELESSRVALKVIDDKLLNEIVVQSKVFLPVLFQGLTVCDSTDDLMMVMKISNDGNLEDHMQHLPLGDLDLKTITGTILRLAANLADLHKIGMCHRNIHPRNVVCTDNDYFLVDYRFATPAHESSQVIAMTRAVYGRLPYIAPEIRQGRCTEKSDIFSLGVIIWQLVSKVIFPSPEVLLAEGGIEDVYRIEPVPGVPEWYEKLYIACMEPQPENRPDTSEICQALQPIHDSLAYSVPLDSKVTEYIVARRAEAAAHTRTCTKLKGIVPSNTTSRLYTLAHLPSTTAMLAPMPFTHRRFSAVWPY